MSKLIITVAPTGNVPTKKLNPHSVLENYEIVQDLILCEKAGASVAHLHVRDSDSKPTSDRGLFEDLIKRMDSAGLKMIKQLSTGARGGKNTIDYRSQMLDLNVEMASLSTGSSNFPTSVNSNSPELIESLARTMFNNGIKPEIEIFDVAMIKNTNWLIKKGIINPKLHFNLVMNVPGSIPGTPKNLMFLIDSLPSNSTFSVSGIGKSQITMLTMAILMGGHVRTGLEDVLMYDDNTYATNEILVKRIVRIANELGREIATTDEARGILNL